MNHIDTLFTYQDLARIIDSLVNVLYLNARTHTSSRSCSEIRVDNGILLANDRRSDSITCDDTTIDVGCKKFLLIKRYKSNFAIK